MSQAIAPGATIGILGGGQLGRMIALAAARLGYRCHVFCPEREFPASQVCDAATVAAYDDKAALARFAGNVDVVTLEFENLPLVAVETLSEHVPVRPGARALEVAQDRLAEKVFLNSIGVLTTGFRRAAGAGDVADAVAALGTPCVLKTNRMGYDGKGQVRIDDAAQADAAWAEMGGSLGIVEGFVNFEREISVIVARGVDGAMVPYCAVENRHANHILDVTIAPAPISDAVAKAARHCALHTAEALEIVGLVAVEMFVTPAGGVLVNEIAPRPHNSGHWTIDACLTSQFEQTVRAVCGLPLGSPERIADAEMKNLLGDAAHDWLDVLDDPDAKLHLYGKAEAREGRKMGHVTRLKPRS
ncbi:MAG: 5-(carboxyamino)imidazole ribonucleotide synthase [Alphaproteobacteria bacterium]|nr:5-(carboxyamino)imidazole ribonucleotide synthase [Alphaproteobacteria bacterium]